MSSSRTLDGFSAMTRLAALQGTLLLIALGALIYTLQWAALKAERTAAEQRMESELATWAAWHGEGGTQALKANHEGIALTSHAGYRLVDANGKTLADTLSERTAAYPLPSAPPLLKDVEHQTMLLPDAHDRGDLLLGYRRLPRGEVLCLASFDDEARVRLGNLRYWLWGLAAIAAGLLLVPLGWVASELIQPLRRLVHRAAQLAESDEKQRLGDAQKLPELRALGEVLDGERDRVSALTNELQSANDLLAHELRTPLARIRGNLERLLKAPDDAKAQAAVAHGLDEIDRAAALMQKILTTRAGDHKALKLHLQVVDLGDLLDHVHELYLPAAEDRGLELRFTLRRSCLFLMDRQMLTQAVANLLDNALAYTPRGGWVELSLDVVSNSAYVRVSDNGPGMRDELEMERIWHRFVRGSVANAQTPGMGLGLNLVKAISIAHGGKASCANRPEGGAEFCITLPVVAPGSA